MILFKGFNLLKLNESINLLLSSFLSPICSFCLLMEITSGGNAK